MARGRGGKRTPEKPAAVSGPGALSKRTDGGPSDAQPVRVAPGQTYGERQQMEAQQRGAPIRDVRGEPAPPSPSAPRRGPLPGATGTQSVFRQPSQRPGGPVNPMMGNQALPGDPQALLRVLYAILPSPDIARLLSDGP